MPPELTDARSRSTGDRSIAVLRTAVPICALRKEENSLISP